MWAGWGQAGDRWGQKSRGLHRAGGTGPRKPGGERKWDQDPRGWGEAVKQRRGTVWKAGD